MDHTPAPDRRPPDARAATLPAEWPLVWPVVALVCAWGAFSAPWLSGALTIPWDGKAHFAPQVQFMAASFARGEMPFWTPHVFGGHPQIADPQSMLFSPPMALLALLNPAPSSWAIDAVVLLMLLVGGIGVLIFARDNGWHWAGALVAAIGFAFGAAMAWRLQHFGQVFSLAYLPLVLVLLQRALRHSHAGYGAGAGLMAGLLVLGRDQVALLSIYVLIGFVLSHWCLSHSPFMAIRKSLRPLLAGVAMGLAAITVPVALTLGLADQSNRPSISLADAGAGSLHPALLVTSVVPHLFGPGGDMADYWGPPSFTWENTGLFIAQNMGLIYIGALPLLMLAFGVAQGWIWRREVRWLAICLGLLVCYALGWYTPVFGLFHEHVPGVSLYRRPADAVFLIGGVGALLAGFATSCWVREATKPDLRAFLAVMLVVALGFGSAAVFALIYDRTGPAIWPMAGAGATFLIANATLVIARRWRADRQLLAGSLIVAVSGADIILNNGPNGASALPAKSLTMLDPAAPNKTIATLKRLVAASTSDTRRDRIEIVGLGYHWPNTPLTHGLESTLGANPVRLGHYVRATGAGDTVALGEQRNFPPAFPSYRSRLANLLGLRYIAAGMPIAAIDKSLDATPFKLVARTGKAWIYENPDALPRVRIVPTAQAVDFDKIVRTGIWPDLPPRRAVLLHRTGEASATDSALAPLANPGFGEDLDLHQQPCRG